MTTTRTHHSRNSLCAAPVLCVTGHPACQSLNLSSCSARLRLMNCPLNVWLSGIALGVGHICLFVTQTGKAEPSLAVMVRSKGGSADSTPPCVIPCMGKLLENSE